MAGWRLAVRQGRPSRTRAARTELNHFVGGLPFDGFGVDLRRLISSEKYLRNFSGLKGDFSTPAQINPKSLSDIKPR